MLNKFKTITYRILGKIFRNYLFAGSIQLFGYFFTPINMILFILYSIFMVLNTVDVWTGRFSRRKVVHDRWFWGTTGFLIMTLLLWLGYLFCDDHLGIGTADYELLPRGDGLYYIIAAGFIICIFGIINFFSYLYKKMKQKEHDKTDDHVKNDGNNIKLLNDVDWWERNWWRKL